MQRAMRDLRVHTTMLSCRRRRRGSAYSHVMASRLLVRRYRRATCSCGCKRSACVRLAARPICSTWTNTSLYTSRSSSCSGSRRCLTAAAAATERCSRLSDSARAAWTYFTSMRSSSTSHRRSSAPDAVVDESRASRPKYCHPFRP